MASYVVQIKSIKRSVVSGIIVRLVTKSGRRHKTLPLCWIKYRCELEEKFISMDENEIITLEIEKFQQDCSFIIKELFSEGKVHQAAQMMFIIENHIRFSIPTMNIQEQILIN